MLLCPTSSATIKHVSAVRIRVGRIFLPGLRFSGSIQLTSASFQRIYAANTDQLARRRAYEVRLTSNRLFVKEMTDESSRLKKTYEVSDWKALFSSATEVPKFVWTHELPVARRSSEWSSQDNVREASGLLRTSQRSVVASLHNA